MTEHFFSLDDLTLDGVWLTIGTFDGVHLGHQTIVRRLVQQAHAAGAPAAVLTFHPHPAVILRGAPEAYYLTHPDERVKLFQQLGIDVVITHPFDRQVAGLSALEFLERLKRHLGLRRLLVGPDFALGRGREGDIPRLRELGFQLGYELEVIERVDINGENISSSRIRQLLLQGEVKKARGMLGRHYHVSGLVVHGDGRGRKIDIPTANLEIWPGRLLPAIGVYACWVGYRGQVLPAVTNIGVRPTFGDQDPGLRLETHILDFRADLYGQELSVYFVDYLRPEHRFPNVVALLEQIRADIQQARQILTDPPDLLFD